MSTASYFEFSVGQGSFTRAAPAGTSDLIRWPGLIARRKPCRPDPRRTGGHQLRGRHGLYRRRIAPGPPGFRTATDDAPARVLDVAAGHGLAGKSRGIRELLGATVAVIVSDSFGSAVRDGAYGAAIGIAGIRHAEEPQGDADLAATPPVR